MAGRVEGAAADGLAEPVFCELHPATIHTAPTRSRTPMTLNLLMDFDFSLNMLISFHRPKPT
jgi:hypothetical protein